MRVLIEVDAKHVRILHQIAEMLNDPQHTVSESRGMMLRHDLNCQMLNGHYCKCEQYNACHVPHGKTQVVITTPVLPLACREG